MFQGLAYWKFRVINVLKVTGKWLFELGFRVFRIEVLWVAPA